MIKSGLIFSMGINRFGRHIYELVVSPTTHMCVSVVCNCCASYDITEDEINIYSDNYITNIFCI